PGVGLLPPLVPRPAQDRPGPDAFATVLALSLGDGLGGVRYRVWPLLLAIQLVAWMAIALVAWSQQLRSPAKPQRG
ncbi:MAG: hypothetical protein M3010_13055, partial [Candidatus Dormibacteraeota bacterium]|nr:hypothetical protein [Candidatus Dormibacteraeota bacterium]